MKTWSRCRATQSNPLSQSLVCLWHCAGQVAVHAVSSGDLDDALSEAAIKHDVESSSTTRPQPQL